MPTLARHAANDQLKLLSRLASRAMEKKWGLAHRQNASGYVGPFSDQ
jgi:hypothetical protein